MNAGTTGSSPKTTVKAAGAATTSEDKPKDAGNPTQGEWFYTCDGKRLGPVSFEELKDMAAKSALNPRKDKVWREGMDVWKPVGRVDGIFGGSDPASQNSETTESASAEDADSSSKMNLVTADATMPGAQRGILITAVVFAIALKFTLAAVGQIPTGIQPLVLFVPLLVLFYLSMERMRNLGMNRWWVLAFMVPILNLWLGYRCMVCPAGYAHHKQTDSSSKPLTIAYAVIVLTGIWAFWS